MLAGGGTTFIEGTAAVVKGFRKGNAADNSAQEPEGGKGYTKSVRAHSWLGWCAATSTDNITFLPT